MIDPPQWESFLILRICFDASWLMLAIVVPRVLQPYLDINNKQVSSWMLRERKFEVLIDRATEETKRTNQPLH